MKRKKYNKNGKMYYRESITIGKRLNKDGLWVDHRKYFYADTITELEKKIKEYMKKRSEGLSTEKQCFGELADYFVYKIFIHDGSLTNSTKHKYVQAYERHFRTSSIAGLSLQKVNTILLQEYYDSLVCSDSALKSVHNLLRRMFKYLSTQGYCKDVTSNLVLPQKKTSPTNMEKKILVWDEYEIERIVANLNNYPNRQLVLAILIAMHTGARISEILAIKYTDINNGKLTINKQLIQHVDLGLGEKKNTIFIVGSTKTKASNRSIPLTEKVVAEIERYSLWHKEQQLKIGFRSEYVFTTGTGRFIDRHNLDTALERYLKKIGIDPDKHKAQKSRKFHAFRSTFGSNLCKQGVPIQVASELLGHDSIDVTKKYYVNIDDSQKQNAVEILARLYA